MKKVLLDTDIIIDFLRNGIDPSNIFKKITEKNTQAYVSSITTFELYNGALLSPNPKQKLEVLDQLLRAIEVIPFDNSQSYVASKIYTFLVKKGRILDMRDVLISSCAVAKNLKLFTSNKKHFKRIPELKLL